MKELLYNLRRILERNLGYNVDDLYVGRIKYNCDNFNKCRVTSKFIFKKIIKSGGVRYEKICDEEILSTTPISNGMWIDDLLPFRDVFPYVSRPTYLDILELSMMLFEDFKYEIYQKNSYKLVK